mgnify:CR=1 FL=1
MWAPGTWGINGATDPICKFILYIGSYFFILDNGEDKVVFLKEQNGRVKDNIHI